MVWSLATPPGGADDGIATEGLGSVFGDFGRRTLGFERSLGGVFALAGLPVAWYLLVQIDDLPSHCEQLAVGVSVSSADSSSPRAEDQLC